MKKESVFSLNRKVGSDLTGESINTQLKGHAAEVNWKFRETAQVLHEWADIFNREFDLGLQVPAIRIDPICVWQLETYRCGRNGFGLHHEITINARHLGRSLPETLCTLFHELLHEWQFLYGKYGKPASGNYHNRQFQHKARLYGLIVDSRGHTWVEPGRFTVLLAKYEVDSRSLPNPEERPLPAGYRGNSKMRKYRCGCTTVRCAVDLRAFCCKCGLEFEEAPPSW